MINCKKKKFQYIKNLTTTIPTTRTTTAFVAIGTSFQVEKHAKMQKNPKISLNEKALVHL